MPPGNRHGGITFLLLGGMQPLLPMHLPFYSNPSGYAQASWQQNSPGVV